MYHSNGCSSPPSDTNTGAISPKRPALEHAPGGRSSRPPRLLAAQPPPVREAAMTARPIAPVIPAARPGHAGRLLVHGGGPGDAGACPVPARRGRTVMSTVNSTASQHAVVEAALVLLERMGLSPADLVAAPRNQQRVPTFAEYVPVVS